MRKVLALALTITLAFLDSRVIFALALSDAPNEGQSAATVRDARRLGGPTALHRPSLTTVETLRKMTSRPEIAADLRKVLNDAGLPQVSDAVISAMSSASTANDVGTCGDVGPADGTVSECAFEPGSVLQWMALRPNIAKKDRTPGIVGPIRWSGRRPFRAFLFRVENASRVYTFVVPKECGNLSLLSDVAAPPPPPPPAPAPRPAAPPPAPAPAPAKPAPVVQDQKMTVEGVAQDAAQQPLPRVNVRLVTADGKTIVAQAVTNDAGQFAFVGIEPGNYIVQILDATGRIVGTSAAITAAAGAATVTVGVTAAAAGAIAAAAGSGIGLFGLGTLGTVAVLGGAAVVTGLAIKATQDEASPSR